MRSCVVRSRAGESENRVDAQPVRCVHGGAAARKHVGLPRQKSVARDTVTSGACNAIAT